MSSLSFDFEADPRGDYTVHADAGESRATAPSYGAGEPEAFAGQLHRFVMQQGAAAEVAQKNTQPSAAAPEPTISAATWTAWLERYVSAAGAVPSPGPDASAAGDAAPAVSAAGLLTADNLEASDNTPVSFADAPPQVIDASAGQGAGRHLGGPTRQLIAEPNGRTMAMAVGAEASQATNVAAEAFQNAVDAETIPAQSSLPTDALGAAQSALPPESPQHAVAEVSASQSASHDVGVAAARAMSAVGSDTVTISRPAGGDADTMPPADTLATAASDIDIEAARDAAAERGLATELTPLSTPRALEAAGARAAQDFSVAAKATAHTDAYGMRALEPSAQAFEGAAENASAVSAANLQRPVTDGEDASGRDLNGDLKDVGKAVAADAHKQTTAASFYASQLAHPDDAEAVGEAVGAEVADAAPATKSAKGIDAAGAQKAPRTDRAVRNDDDANQAVPSAAWVATPWQAIQSAPPGLLETQAAKPGIDDAARAAAGLHAYRNGALAGRSPVDSAGGDSVEETKTAATQGYGAAQQQASASIAKSARGAEDTAFDAQEGGQRDGQFSAFHATATAGAAAAGAAAQGMQATTDQPAPGVQQIASGLAVSQPVPVHRISDQLAARINEGARRIELRVAPPGLGTLDIAVQVQGGQVNLTVRGEAPDLSQHLQRDMGELQRNLAQHGLDLGHTDFGGSGTASEGQREGPAQGHATGHNNSTSAGGRASAAVPAARQGGASVINVVL